MKRGGEVFLVSSGYTLKGGCDAIVVWPARLGCDFMTSRVHALSRPSLLVVSEQPAKRDFHFFLDSGFLALLLSLFLNLNISHTCNCHALAMVAASETPPLPPPALGEATKKYTSTWKEYL